MFGVYGTRPTPEMLSLFRETGASGVLLLGRNIETAAQTRALTRELVQRLGRPLIFAVDHEGGWVLRFKEGVTALPGNAALGRAGLPRLAYETGRAMARDLRRLGIGLNLAPVLDVVKDYNPGIGIRSFGADPRLAGKLGAAMIRGLQDHGVSACAKHFPGKGAARVDAHVSLPVIRLAPAEFERDHLAPFRAAVNAGVDCVMTSHVRYPALDRAPATFSPRITRDLLRERLGFRGVVVADDLCMGAVTGRLPIQAAALKTLEAGHDLLLIAHDTRAQFEAVELLRRAKVQRAPDVSNDDRALNQERLRASLRRVAGLMGRGAGSRPAGSSAGDRRLAERVAGQALEVLATQGPGLGWRPDGRPPLILFPDFREVRERFTFEGGPLGPERWLKAAAGRWGPARVLRTPVERKELGGLAQAVRRAPRVLFFCFEAMRFPGQRAVLDLVQGSAMEKTAVALIRNPWDRRLLKPGGAAVDAKGYRLSSLKTALHAVLRLAALAALAVGASPAAAQAPPAPVELDLRGPAPAAGIGRLHALFIEAVEMESRREILKELSQTAPATPQEVQWLYDLFARFPTAEVRGAVMISLYRTDPGARHLDKVFLEYLEDKEAESILWGINGALVLRTQEALPMIRKVARRRLPAGDPSEIMFVSERNEWWTIYEALSALARWEGEKAFDLLKGRAKDSPKTAKILGERLWEKSLPLFIKWSSSRNENSRRAAIEGLSADADSDALRRTRPRMLEVLRDRRSESELRHLLAVQIGRSSTDAEVEGLLREREGLPEQEDKLLWAAALFASRNPRTVPLLKEFARNDPDPFKRAKALWQLKDMAAPGDYRELLQWLAENDAEEDVRRIAREELARTQPPLR